MSTVALTCVRCQERPQRYAEYCDQCWRFSPVARAAAVMREAYKYSEHVFLYAIQQGESGPIKIGLAKHPRDRLKTLQQGNPERLRGIAAWRALPIEERIFHEEFAADRLVGEWFRPTPELVDLVLRHGGFFEDWT